MYENYLAHWGKKGMRWGLHIFGKKPSPGTKAVHGKLITPDSPHAGAKKTSSTESRPKSLEEYSDADLQKLVTRMDMEKRYKTLMAELHPAKKSRLRTITTSLFDRLQDKGVSLAVDLLDAKFREKYNLHKKK